MAARTKSKVPPKYKTKYSVQNLPAYEASLRQRGDVTVWFDEGAIGAWNALPCGHPGGQPVGAQARSGSPPVPRARPTRRGGMARP